MFIVHIPAMRGKVEGWLRSTIFTTCQDRATRYETEDAARAAITKAAKFHLKSQIKALQIVPAPATTEAAP